VSFCTRCGQSLSFFEAIRGHEMHPECRQAHEAEERRKRLEADAERLREEKEKEQQRRQFYSQAMAQIERGEFRELPVPTDIVLQPEEKCYGYVKGCWRAQLYPSIVGRRARPVGSDEIRDDGIARKERGDLFITQRRIIFVSPVMSSELLMKKVLQCSVASDVLHIAVSGRSSGARFIIPDPQYIEVMASLIRKVASLSKAK